jgi:hypothetical protein
MGNLLFIATTEDILKYDRRTCNDVRPLFLQEFGREAENERPLVNFFLHGTARYRIIYSLHGNMGVWLPEDYGFRKNKLYFLDQ